MPVPQAAYVESWEEKNGRGSERKAALDDEWTVERIPDLRGRTAIVSGGNSGIGLATATILAQRGATTLLACRDLSRADRAAEAIRRSGPHGTVGVLRLDLADLASVRKAAASFRGEHDRLDLLINSAGVMLVPYGTTRDGFERHFGINHLGHFAWTGLLFDVLRATEGSRVVSVSSLGHGRRGLDFENLMFESGGYSRARGYARSKLANLLFTLELQRRFDGTGLLAVAAHPGGAPTGLGRRMDERWLWQASRPVLEWLSQRVTDAARPILRAATDPDAKGGAFYGPGGRLGFRGPPRVVQPHRCALDAAAAGRLWDVSETLTGVRFPDDERGNEG